MEEPERPRGWRRHRASGVLIAFVATYMAVFGVLTWQQQQNMATFGFDMGIFDQGIWLLSRLKEPFVTVRGLNYFGNHVNLSTVLLVPFYWLGGGAGFLALFQTAAIAGGAIAVWLVARDLWSSEWAALVPALAYLLFPSLEWINWWHFHPETLAIVPVLVAYWLALRRRWGWYAVAIALALAAKEDVAITVFALGLLVAWRGHRRPGLLTSLAAGLWLLVCMKAVIPLANSGRGPFYDQLFVGFGTTAISAALAMVLHPLKLLQLATEASRLTYYLQLLAPVAFLPLGAPGVLAAAAPQVVVNISSVQPYTHQIKYQYSSLVSVIVILATIESITHLGRQRWARRFLLIVLVGSSVAANVAWSPSPLGRDYDDRTWVRSSPYQQVARRALAMVPSQAGVSASYHLVPQLTHRVWVYEFPNPWRTCNWGIRGERPANPGTVEYLVLDLAATQPHLALYRRLVAPEGSFRVVFQKDTIVVARRVASAIGRDPIPAHC